MLTLDEHFPTKEDLNNLTKFRLSYSEFCDIPAKDFRRMLTEPVVIKRIKKYVAVDCQGYIDYGDLLHSLNTKHWIPRVHNIIASYKKIRRQVLEWHKMSDKLPEYKRLLLIKVPDRPWYAPEISGDIRQDVAWLEEHEIEGNHKKPYCFRTFGPSSYFGDEVTEWAYL